jgi:hypothetical protein
MRVWTVPALVAGILVVTGHSDEPSETAMRSAFAATLAADVRASLDFVAATGGEAALARVRAARTDAFDIRAFTKLACTPVKAGQPGGQPGGHVCDFAVRIGVVTGEIERTITGRFYATPHGLAFVEEGAPAGA